MAKRKHARVLESLELHVTVAASPREVFESWIDGDKHSAMTGAPATSEPKVGGRFTAWDGYIEGTHTELTPGKRIVQSWRSSDFPDDAPDSQVEIDLGAAPKGTRVTLKHTNIPAGQAKSYESGWSEFYFEPMRKRWPES
ncbi:MAG: SRPBCC domain-containing protein [Deltaproteobacteria bacterium]|nr:SRPBCC domain-containing protein [Deltaproteobacteria bacterium]